jgi:hypothetical protein
MPPPQRWTPTRRDWNAPTHAYLLAAGGCDSGHTAPTVAPARARAPMRMETAAAAVTAPPEAACHHGRDGQIPITISVAAHPRRGGLPRPASAAASNRRHTWPKDPPVTTTTPTPVKGFLTRRVPNTAFTAAVRRLTVQLGATAYDDACCRTRCESDARPQSTTTTRSATPTQSSRLSQSVSAAAAPKRSLVGVQTARRYDSDFEARLDRVGWTLSHWGARRYSERASKLEELGCPRLQQLYLLSQCGEGGGADNTLLPA